MRAKLIEKEFKRGQYPKKSLDIGRESTAVKKKLFDDLKKKIRVNIRFTEDDRHVLKNIRSYIKMIKRLTSIGVNLDQINISDKELSINKYRVLNSNVVIGEFLIKKDGELLVKLMNKYSAETHKTFYVSDHASSFPGYYTLNEMNIVLNDRAGNDG